MGSIHILPPDSTSYPIMKISDFEEILTHCGYAITSLELYSSLKISRRSLDENDFIRLLMGKIFEIDDKYSFSDLLNIFTENCSNLEKLVICL